MTFLGEHQRDHNKEAAAFEAKEQYFDLKGDIGRDRRGASCYLNNDTALLSGGEHRGITFQTMTVSL